MLKIIDDDIHLTRGDTAELTLSIMVNDDEEYTLGDNDVCVLTVKASALKSTSLLQVELDENNIFKIEPSDTNNLQYGKYKYDVQITLANSDVYTIIPIHNFFIEQEVTY